MISVVPSHVVILIAAALAASIFPGYAADQSAARCGNVEMPGFVPAQIDVKPSLRYPKNPYIDRNEGWVLLEYTVSTDGSIRDTVVRDAIGPAELVHESLRVVPTWTFHPATRNGVPVDEHRKLTEVVFRYISASISPTNTHEFVVVYFSLEPAYLLASSHSAFDGPFRRGTDQFENKKNAEAIETLEKMLAGVPLDLFERARASLVLARAYSETGDYARAYHHIGHATIRNAENLEKRRRGDAITLQMKLAIQMGAFAEATCAFERLSSIDPAAAAPGSSAGKMMAAINAVLANPAPLEIPAKLAVIPHLGEPAGWQHRLLRSKFSFSQVQGDVKTFHLGCTGTVLDAAVDHEQQWSVPANAGTCVLHVNGAPNATFRLVEE